MGIVVMAFMPFDFLRRKDTRLYGNALHGALAEKLLGSEICFLNLCELRVPKIIQSRINSPASLQDLRYLNLKTVIACVCWCFLPLYFEQT